MSGERWRPVSGYETRYEVSDAGRVRSLDRLDTQGRCRRGKVLSPRRARSGHLVVALFDGQRRSILLHHIVLEAFVGPRPQGLDGCHANDVPDDNRPENLRWDTRSANVLDSVRNGTHHMARRTQCPKGHEYTVENTRIKPNGSRVCRECSRSYRETHREQRRAIGREYMRRKRAAQKEVM